MSRRLRPLVYGPQDWADVREHYAEDWDGYTDELDDEEPIPEDCMAEDFNRAIDDLNGLYPHHFDHDRRYDDQYSQQQGDLGDEEIPF